MRQQCPSANSKAPKDERWKSKRVGTVSSEGDGVTAVQSNMEPPLKRKNRSAAWFCHPVFLRVYPKELETGSQRDIYTHARGSVTHSGRETEATQCPLLEEGRKGMRSLQTVEYSSALKHEWNVIVLQYGGTWRTSWNKSVSGQFIWGI